MSNLQILQDGYAAFGAGDVETATAPWPDDFVWQGANDQLPGGGRAEGKGAALQALGQTTSRLPGFRLEVDDFVGDGDRIVMLGRQHFDGPDGPVDSDVVHVWRFADGVPRELHVYGDTLLMSQALAAADA